MSHLRLLIVKKVCNFLACKLMSMKVVFTSASGRCRISSTLLASPLAAAFTSSSLTSPETCVSNNFFKSALSLSGNAKEKIQ